MSDRRIVMRVEVIWVTSDPNDLVERAFRQYDEMDNPSPVDFVAAALRMASTEWDWTVSAHQMRVGGGFEVRVDGPARWSVAFDDTEQE
jgi:hypothetical protein